MNNSFIACSLQISALASLLVKVIIRNAISDKIFERSGQALCRWFCAIPDSTNIPKREKEISRSQSNRSEFNLFLEQEMTPLWSSVYYLFLIHYTQRKTGDIY